MNFIFMRHFIAEDDTSNSGVADPKQLQPYIDFINHTNEGPIPILLTNPSLVGSISFTPAEKNSITGLYKIDMKNPLSDPQTYLEDYMFNTSLIYEEVKEEEGTGDEKKEVTYYKGLLKAGITTETYGFTQFNICRLTESDQYQNYIFFIGFQTSNGSSHLNFNAPYVIFGLKFSDALNAFETFVYATPDRFSVGIGQPDGTSIANRSKMFSFYLEPRVTLVRYNEYDNPYLSAYAFKINWNTN